MTMPCTRVFDAHPRGCWRAGPTGHGPRTDALHCSQSVCACVHQSVCLHHMSDSLWFMLRGILEEAQPSLLPVRQVLYSVVSYATDTYVFASNGHCAVFTACTRAASFAVVIPSQKGTVRTTLPVYHIYVNRWVTAEKAPVWVSTLLFFSRSRTMGLVVRRTPGRISLPSYGVALVIHLPPFLSYPPV